MQNIKIVLFLSIENVIHSLLFEFFIPHMLIFKF